MRLCPSPKHKVLTHAAAVVYLKNRISKGWSPAEEYSQAKPIPEEEKTSFRNRLVPILVASPPQVRLQLIPTLQKILAFDFPQKWPDFLDITIQLLNAGDIASVFAGVQCLLAICKIYRFKSGENRADFDRIVGMSFPQLLNIGNSLANETSLEAGEILRTVLKVYKHAIYVSNFQEQILGMANNLQFDLPESLREQQTMVGWCTLFLTVVGKEPPEASLPEDLDERETNHWWKAKKWSYANLNRLYVRWVHSIGLLQDATNTSQVRQPFRTGQEQRCRLHRRREELHCQLCARNPKSLPPTGRKVGRETGLAVQGQLVLHPQLP
jgi:hypothetical protein